MLLRENQIRDQIPETESLYDREKLQQRLASLAGGIAVVKVGGGSEIEVKEVRDRFEDALNATRSAIDEGIVPGGGTALLYASQNLENEIETDTFDEQIGVNIVANAVR